VLNAASADSLSTFAALAGRGGTSTLAVEMRRLCRVRNLLLRNQEDAFSAEISVAAPDAITKLRKRLLFKRRGQFVSWSDKGDLGPQQQTRLDYRSRHAKHERCRKQSNGCEH